MEKGRIIDALQETADLAELLGENPFKVRAFANAARTLKSASSRPVDWTRPGVLEEIRGVGKGIARFVREMIRTGCASELEAYRSKVPEGVREILQVQGVGPRKVAVLWRDIGVESPGELEYACLENRLVTLPGFGSKSQERVLNGVRFLMANRGKALLPSILNFQENLFYESEFPASELWAWTGEAGRMLETVSEVHLLTCHRPLAEELGRLRKLSKEGDSWRGAASPGVPFVVSLVDEVHFGSRCVWETCSAGFRSARAGRLEARGLRWTQEGLHGPSGAVPTAVETEFWRAAALDPVPAECRELPEALDFDFSSLLKASDLAGAFHVHTDWSDGGASLETMVESARSLGWDYVGICDHSKTAVYAGGLDETRLKGQGKEIDVLQKAHPEIRIFKGVESDIMAEGALDYEDRVLAGLELVVASVHSRFGLARDAQTLRLVRAVKHPATTFLGHPTGRLLLGREPYTHDWEAVASAASEAGICIELNANPHRLDVDWRRIPGLRKRGVPIALNPDAHSPDGLRDVRYGVLMARKALCRREDILNTLDRQSIEEWLESKKEAER
ncbi:MAG: PHP domain-containing protein [Acidobacteriota bacterium]